MHFKKLPSQEELVWFKKEVHKNRVLPEGVKTLLKIIPKGSDCMDVLRETTGLMGSLEPESKENTPIKIAIRLLGVQLTAIAFWYKYH